MKSSLIFATKMEDIKFDDLGNNVENIEAVATLCSYLQLSADATIPFGMGKFIHVELHNTIELVNLFGALVALCKRMVPEETTIGRAMNLAAMLFMDKKKFMEKERNSTDKKINEKTILMSLLKEIDSEFFDEDEDVMVKPGYTFDNFSQQ